MPIANCFVRADLAAKPEIEGLVALWSEESGVSHEHMTVNVLDGTRQSGARYDVMAFVYLPSLWSGSDVERLQVGLSRALCRAFSVDPVRVHVITSMVESGHVVENGEVQRW